MKISLTIISLLIAYATHSQIDTLNQSMVSMKNTIEKPHKVGSVYYKKGESQPYSGVLYGKYKNGKYLSIQEYKNGVGNGKWINYYESGNIKEIGHYNDNRVEGPISQYHPNGVLKAKGTYAHWRKKVGTWTYYNENGNLIKTVDYNTLNKT